MGEPVDKLTIRGFKSIRALEELELRNLNILIGANGSGKSNFVSFFSLLQAIADQSLKLTIEKAGGADAHLYLGPKLTDTLKGRIWIGSSSYEFALEPTYRNRFVFSDERLYDQSDEARLGGGHDEAKLTDLAHDLKPQGLAFPIYSSLLNRVAYHFHDTSDSAAVRRQGTTRDFGRLRSDATNLAAFLLRLREEDGSAYGLIRDTVRLAAPFFDDFKLRPEKNGADTVVQLEWTQKGSDYPFHPSQLSDGTLRFICLATALLQPNPPATILLDEPELGLHPYALNLLGGLLKQAAAKTQVIVSTQSAPLLDSFDPADIIVVERVDGASTFRRLEEPALEQWLEEYSLGELWRKNMLEDGPTHE